MGSETSTLSKRTGFSPATIKNLRKAYNSLIKKTDLSTEDLYLNFDLDQDTCDLLFKALDRDGDGNVRFADFVIVLYLLGPAPLDEKSDFCFELYDRSKRGCLIPREYREASMHAVYTMDELRSTFNRLLDEEQKDEEHKEVRENVDSQEHDGIRRVKLIDDSATKATNSVKKLILNGFMDTAFSVGEALKKEPTLEEIQSTITETFLEQARLDDNGRITANEFKRYAREHPEVLMTLVHLRKCLVDLLNNKRQRKPRRPPWSITTFSLNSNLD
eukprot:TRINITY_DN16395_c0_g1_i1.p1 TRINITY_DN16395_c0_g1~~TRINITY_DN16395_c0_g1_i1.p1  ORF type:complete len:274 (-),score=49.21 TRINITY_DN16395_c0_g1_i1:71-892(-)